MSVERVDFLGTLALVSERRIKMKSIRRRNSKDGMKIYMARW